jgi:hypothetical protein
MAWLFGRRNPMNSFFYLTYNRRYTAWFHVEDDQELERSLDNRLECR